MATLVLGLYRLLRTDEPVFVRPRQNLIMRSCADLEHVGDLWRAKMGIAMISHTVV